jgi:hypothetical protein
MMIAYQRNYALHMDIAYKLMVEQENKTALWGYIYQTEHTTRLYRIVFI